MSKSSFLRLMLNNARHLLDPVQPVEEPREAPAIGVKHVVPGRVTEIGDFGSNPGELRMFVYAPAPRLPLKAPLIVVLHGCGQEAAAFAAQTGWLGLADRIGAAVLLPEQQVANSRGRCFNWFHPADARRGRGEALSILQMVGAAVKRFGSDPRRVFIVGLSAGGAMTAALLAAYPSVFSAGAIVAGMPVGAAQNLPMAVLRMRQAEPFKGRGALADAVRHSAPAHAMHAWPRVSIWHGDADKIVHPANALSLAAQWSEVHGFTEAAGVATQGLAPGLQHRAWGEPSRPQVELWTIAGMEHCFPIDGTGRNGSAPGFAVLEAGISATEHIARFWGFAS